MSISLGGTVSPYDSLGIAYSFVLTTYELNLIKMGGQGTGLMGKAATGTYLTMPYGVTRALDKGAIVPYLKSVQISKTAARVVTTLSLDVTPPNLLSFDLDVGHSWLYLNFDEPVVAEELVLINKSESPATPCCYQTPSVTRHPLLPAPPPHCSAHDTTTPSQALFPPPLLPYPPVFALSLPPLCPFSTPLTLFLPLLYPF